MRTLAKELWSLLEKTNEREQQKVLTSFIAVLAAKRQLYKAREVITDFETQASQRGDIKPTVISKKEDATVIGGARVSKGFTVADATVRGRLQRLRQSLNS